MPRFKGSCGCYNRHDARVLGLVPAIIWNDMLDRAEHFDANPMWYDQKAAAERLGIEYHRLNRAVKTLEDAGRITTEGGLRPKSSVRTTWVTILAEECDPSEISNSNFRNEQNDDFGNEQNEISILNDTKERDSVTESQTEGPSLSINILFPKLVSTFKRAGFTIVNKKQLKEKTEKLLEMFKEDGTNITINQFIDAANNFINGDWDGKSFQKFLSPNVFPYCLKNNTPSPQRVKGLEHFRKFGD